MKIFTNEAIRKIDRETIAAEGISELDLMERAASAVAFEIISRWRASKRMVIFAGPGNNGGDALAVARMLYEQGYRPEVFLFNIRSSHLSECCEANRQRLLDMGDIDFTEIVDNFTPPELGADDVVIDGLFGSGLHSPLKGGYTSLVQYINNSDAFIVSIDMPSGLFCEWNEGSDRRNIIRADLTFTFGAKRLSFFFSENAEFIGQCVVLDIDLDSQAVASTPSDYYLIEKEDVREKLQDLDPFINKYDNGTLYLIAGSYGMMGAAILACRGALRIGTGLVKVHGPASANTIMQTSCPEALFEPDSSDICTTSINVKHRCSVIALGPGMGTSDETIDALDHFLKNYNKPCLLDADALNGIAARPMLLRSIPKGSVITPHTGEFDRLFCNKNITTDEERFKRAINASKTYNITIVLKGHYTMIVRPDGKVYINSSGNPGMATAGSGDVLTGVISGLIAQGFSPDDSVWMGVYIHGHSGDLAAAKVGERSVIASDIIDNLGPAVIDIKRL
ncbi:MAG: NAD(P)H-hydrate dehydratase [Muribaculaceae bacterium]|nr:NAD(P)H-hydrate dehydratase [Muribaculaceae bacterium]